MRQLTALDASFVYLEQYNSPMHIGSIAVYDPATAPNSFVRYKEILQFIENRLHLANTFRQKLFRVPLNLDHPYWIEDENFDIEYHVRHVALPDPGDWRQLCIQTARLFARPLDLTRPPWELTVIEGLDNVEGVPKGSYAIVSKVHHCAIDGVSGVELLNALHSPSPDVTPPEGVDDWRPEKPPSLGEMAIRGHFNNMKQPLRFLESAQNTAKGLARVAKGVSDHDFETEGMFKTPRTRFNGSISPHRVVEGCIFPLSEIQAIKNAVEGAKVNDVMLAIVGGAMRQYLQSVDELPEDPLIAFAPISIRTKEQSGSMGNQVSGMTVSLGSQIEDPKERLIHIHDKTNQSKALTNAMGARQMAEMSELAPAMFTGMAARLYTQTGMANQVRPTFNTVVTNVPGPQVPIYSNGAEMVKYYGLLCLFDGLGLGHVVQSSNGEVSLTITACREMLPDPEFYAECMQNSFEELKKATLPAHKPATKARPKTKAKTKTKTKASTKKQAAAK